MKLELLVRTLDKSVLLEETDDELLNRLKKEEEDIVPYVYQPYVFDVRDFGVFGREDEEHTKLFTPAGLFYVKIDYNLFKTIYETMTQHLVKTTSDFRMVKRNING